jgi:hypothetical protein
MPIYNEVWDDMGKIYNKRLLIPFKIEPENPASQPFDETGIFEIRLR